MVASPTKYDYAQGLFWPQPPDNPKLVRALFCGREQDLDHCVSRLKASCDVNGKQARNGSKVPWVIHGESRSGKSHLARMVMQKLPKRKKRFQIFVPAKERLEASAVMESIFEALSADFLKATEDVTLKEDLQPYSIVQLTRNLISEVRQFSGGAESVIVKVDAGQKAGLEAGVKLSPIPKIFEFTLTHRSEASDGNTLEVHLAPPSAKDLAEYSGMIVDCLHHVGLLSHVLILVDDADLLETYVNENRNGRVERSRLTDCLCYLHQQPCVDVLLTARSWYTYSRNEFENLNGVGLDPLSPETLVAIHDRHYEVFRRKNAPARFLDSAALESASGLADGKPGIFLRHLQTAFSDYQRESSWGERSYDWFLGVFRQIYLSHKSRYPDAVTALEKAVSRGALSIDVSRGNPFVGTVFDDEFVFQSYYEETSYMASPLIQQVIQNQD